jgi:hypothetical protein
MLKFSSEKREKEDMNTHTTWNRFKGVVVFGMSWRISFPSVFQRFPVTKGRENGRENLSEGMRNRIVVSQVFQGSAKNGYTVRQKNVMI